MTVNLNINHSRPSDLRVTLIGPDNTEVQLTNFNGDNNVNAFGDSSLHGTWRLEVQDTRKKKLARSTAGRSQSTLKRD